MAIQAAIQVRGIRRGRESHSGVCLLHGDTGRRTAHGVCLLRETSASASADQPGAVIIGTFGLTVKLGSATFEFLFSTVPKSTKSIGGAPEGRQCAPLLGRRVSPSLAEFTVVEPD